jgi:hypothetical protein
VLHLSEHAAYNRIETARAARRFPIILELFETGALTLTSVRAPHLTGDNHRDVLARARHKSKREVEVLAATLSPRPDVPSTVRRLPAPATSKVPPPPAPIAETLTPEVSAPIDKPPFVRPASRPAEIKPVAPERYKIHFTVSRETHDKLRRAQDLLRHTVPNGDPAIIFERALRLLVDDLERRRIGKAAHPRAARETNSDSRHIPSAVKRAVWQRDNGRCAFSGSHGRCTETGFLEYHHVLPFASSGATSPHNLELRCRSHNQYEAELWFGGTDRQTAREERAFFDG